MVMNGNDNDNDEDADEKDMKRVFFLILAEPKFTGRQIVIACTRWTSENLYFLNFSTRRTDTIRNRFK